MGLDERFEALRRSGPAAADVDTEAALAAVAARGGRGRRHVGLVLTGAVAAVLLLVVGILALQGDDDAAVVAGEGSGGSGADAAPPPDEGPARLWLSATEVPVGGADVAAVILWDGEGESPTWGVAAALDRWTGAEWVEDRTFTFCPDFWGCVGSIEPAGGWDDLGITTELGVSGALWVRVGGLDPGWYRIRSESNEGGVAAGQFEVVGTGDGPVQRALPHLPPHDADALVARWPVHSVRAPGDVTPSVRLAFADGATPSSWEDVPREVRLQRWGVGWEDVARSPLEVPKDDSGGRPQFASVSLGSTAQQRGDYRIVIERGNGPPLVGRYWVREPSELRTRPTPEEPGAADPSTSSSTDIDDAAGDRPPPDDGPARLWLSATEIPAGGADVAAVILWDGDGPSPTWGVAATLDRWTGTAWEEQVVFSFCVDFWGCSGSLERAGMVPAIGIPAPEGRSSTLWVRVADLQAGWYRIRSEANEDVVAAGQFEVVAAATDSLPPADHVDGAFLTVRPGLLAGRPAGSPPSSDVLDVALSDFGGDPAAIWASAAAEATIQRWDGGRWVDLATVPTGPGTGSVYAASVAVGDLLDREADLRVVIEREDGAPPLVGRFWVRGGG